MSFRQRGSLSSKMPVALASDLAITQITAAHPSHEVGAQSPAVTPRMRGREVLDT
jgi:hypothetical protein